MSWDRFLKTLRVFLVPQGTSGKTLSDVKLKTTCILILKEGPKAKIKGDVFYFNSFL